MPTPDPIKVIPGRKELVDIYAESIRRLKDVVSSPVIGMDERKHAGNQIREIQRHIAELRRNNAAWAKKYIPEAYRNGADQDEAILSRLLGSKYKGRFTKLHTEAAQIAVEAAAADYSKVIDNIENLYEGYVRRVQAETARQSIAREIAGGIVEGQGRENVRNRLLRSISQDVKGATITVGRVTMNAVSYADLLTRTLSRAARTEGTLNRLNEYDIDLVIINNTGAVDFCRIYEDQIFSISGRSKRFPKLTFRPPYHPNCTHILSAFISEFADDGEIERGSNFKQSDLGKNAQAMAKKYPIVKDDTRTRTKKTQKAA